MGINFVTRTVLQNPTPATTIDLPGVDVQTGDLLVFHAGYGLATYSRPTVTDVGTGTIVFTRVPSPISGAVAEQGVIGYSLSCPLTATGVVFRFTWSSLPTAVDIASVEVWRPTAGVTMQLDASPTFSTAASTTSPTSPLITTTTAALVWTLCIGGSGSAKTNPLVAGLTADMYPASPNTALFTTRVALRLATAQTNITANLTSAISDYFAFGAFAFREYSTSVNQTITCRGITLGGTGGSSQEVSVGGIG